MKGMLGNKLCILCIALWCATLVTLVFVTLVVAWVNARAGIAAGFARDMETARTLPGGGSLTLTLPASALDILYHVEPFPYHVNAEFRLSEDAFLEWANEQGWQLDRSVRREVESVWVEPSQAFLWMTVAKRGWVTVEDAWVRWDNDDEVVYDRGRGIVYWSQRYVIPPRGGSSGPEQGQ